MSNILPLFKGMSELYTARKQTQAGDEYAKQDETTPIMIIRGGYKTQILATPPGRKYGMKQIDPEFSG